MQIWNRVKNSTRWLGYCETAAGSQTWHRQAWVSTSVHCIKTRKGFDYLCAFAKANNYNAPHSWMEKIRKDVIDPDGLQEVEARNAEIAVHVQKLTAELNQFLMSPIKDDVEVLKFSTDRFYRWEQESRYSPSFQIIERNLDRVQRIWFDIMRDC